MQALFMRVPQLKQQLFDASSRLDKLVEQTTELICSTTADLVQNVSIANLQSCLILQRSHELLIVQKACHKDNGDSVICVSNSTKYKSKVIMLSCKVSVTKETQQHEQQTK